MPEYLMAHGSQHIGNDPMKLGVRDIVHCLIFIDYLKKLLA